MTACLQLTQARIEALAAKLAREAPAPAPPARGRARAIVHIDMDCFFASVAGARGRGAMHDRVHNPSLGARTLLLAASGPGALLLVAGRLACAATHWAARAGAPPRAPLASPGAASRARPAHAGHGICTNLSRSVTLPRFTGEAAELGREGRALLRAVGVPAADIRGVGLTVRPPLRCHPSRLRCADHAELERRACPRATSAASRSRRARRFHLAVVCAGVAGGVAAWRAGSVHCRCMASSTRMRSASGTQSPASLGSGAQENKIMKCGKRACQRHDVMPLKPGYALQMGF